MKRMISKSTITLVVLLVVLLGFQVSEILRAPDNVVAALKGKAAGAITEHDLVAMYRQKGRTAIEQRCSKPIEKWGYHFTCHLVPIFSSENGGDFTIIDLVVYHWNSAVEAGEMAAFRRSEDRRPKSMHRGESPEFYQIGGDRGAIPYYFIATAATTVDFTDLEKRPSTIEEFNNEFY